MRPRQTVENYWSVWIFNVRAHEGKGMWEPYDEGMSTRSAALKIMREESAKWPHETFAIVKTRNERCPT